MQSYAQVTNAAKDFPFFLLFNMFLMRFCA